MKFEDVHRLVGHVPFIQKANAEYLYNLIVKEKLQNVLELGIAHGTATCYMAAALQELGQGRITSVDLLETAQEFQPTPEDQLERTGEDRIWLVPARQDLRKYQQRDLSRGI
jgi:hypothetical protein